MGAGSSLTQNASTTGGNVNFLPTSRYTGTLAEENAAMQANQNAGTNTVANGQTAQAQPSFAQSPYGIGNPSVNSTTTANIMGSLDPYAGSSFAQRTGGISNMAMPSASNVNSNYQQPTTNSLQSFIGNSANPYANSTDPYLKAANATTMGNLAGAQQATAANRINQSTPYANLTYTQGVDANGNPTWTANQSLAQPLQQSLGNIQGQLAQSTASPFDVSKYQGQTSQGFTGMEGWDKATGLINQRLQPQISQNQERLQAQLANQGIAPGTEAYNRAMTLQGQQTNDLLTQAQLAGSQVQNQMQGQSLAQQQANNAALQQNYAQNLAAKNLPLQQLGIFQQATQPGYVNPYSQAAVSGPDYLGATATSSAAQIAQQNANIAKQNATTQGLYGLGGAALLGSGGLGNLGTGGTGGTGLLGLGGSAYNTLFGNNGMDLLNNSSSIQDYLNSIGATGSGMFDQAMSSNDYLNDLYSGLNLF